MTTDTIAPARQEDAGTPFARFDTGMNARSDVRRAITAAGRLPEAACMAPLLLAATLPAGLRADIAATAVHLVEAVRTRPRGPAMVELAQAFPVSQAEGAALMELAEALPRIPDVATRDAFTRDKMALGHWRLHRPAGHAWSVRLAVRGLAAAGGLARAQARPGFGGALARLAGRAAAPLLRRAIVDAMQHMGAAFVIGETMDEALFRARLREAQGFLYSYDMLGEAAVTHGDAARYLAHYELAIHAIGKAAAGRGVLEGPGISVKLSALHPRYGRAQAARVHAELLPRLRHLAALAKSYDIGFTIDAEEQDRLDLSLDLLEALCDDPALGGWQGLGLAVQAYGRRCPQVIDWVVDLARRSRRRIMVRLVKGAYWDAEIKRAQVEGLNDFPVFTRKEHTDVSYIACARKLLAAREAVFPQFATHNAQTIATVFHLAGPHFSAGSYEFQCLHGMGEALYGAVVGAHGLGRPCRIYAPVGSRETLLPYLARRLLENGANASFVHRLADGGVPVEDLVADPAAGVRARSTPGAPHPRIAAPGALFADRRNSAGLDLSDEDVLHGLCRLLRTEGRRSWRAAPPSGDGVEQQVRNPGDWRDGVGTVVACGPHEAAPAMAAAAAAAPGWAAVPPSRRTAPLLEAAEEMQARMGALMGLVMREAGKSAPDALSEVREAIDFLRYYATAAANLREDQVGLGAVVCISPWNFPLAIFTGQVAAALAAGNTVVAKPAEETPLIAAEAVRILHRAGVPEAVLQFLPGDGALGAALVATPQVAGVMFTGSLDVARHIQGQLAGRLTRRGHPVPFIAETGGQNAMVVDSSAHGPQVAGDVIASAFGSAGQRCSALRVLCLQEEVADGILDLIRGAMAELNVAPTDRLAADVGPVITVAARDAIEDHVARMEARGHGVFRAPLSPQAAHGTFVAPALIEIGTLDELDGEVFGPVLHVVRYRRRDLRALVDAVNAKGYGLTFGLHSRLDSTQAQVEAQVRAGNIYVNRNMIGAVVGVQPFGGRGLSGTGPKAGGPLYLQRLVRGVASLPVSGTDRPPDAAALAFAAWLENQALGSLAETTREWARTAPLGATVALAGPVGESNLYGLAPRGTVLVSAQTRRGMLVLIAAALATGNDVVAVRLPEGAVPRLPRAVRARLTWVSEDEVRGPLDGALAEGDEIRIADLSRRLAALEGPVVPLHVLALQGEVGTAEDLAAELPLAWLMREVSTCVNTAAAGGNANLLAMA